MKAVMVRPRWGAALAALVAALLVFAAGAAAAPKPRAQGVPLWFWEVDKVTQGGGTQWVQKGSQLGGHLGGPLHKAVRLGRVVFNLPLPDPYWTSLPRNDAFGSMFASADGAQYSVLGQSPSPNPLRSGVSKGTISHLDEYQAYQKTSSDASLRVTISQLFLQAADGNLGKLGAWECPPAGNCEPMRAVVRFHVRAYAASERGGDFFDGGGIAYLEGHAHSWRPGAATSGDASRSLWGADQFDVNGDLDDSGTGSLAGMFLKPPRSVRIPLTALPDDELFAVHVTLEAEAVNDRGGESAVQAFIQDPIHGGAPLFTAHGLKPRGKPRFREPRPKLPPAARCPSGPRRGAGSVQLERSALTAEEGSRLPLLLTRSGGSRGAVTVNVSTSGGSAQPGRDFTTTTTRVTFRDGEKTPRFIEIPVRADHKAEAPETFRVSLSHPRCGTLGTRRSTTVTIIDDPQPPTSTPQSFTIGGTVDGLQGSGLVLTNLGGDLPVSGNGHFTFPGTASSGQPYEIVVRTQPHNPDQVCSVQHGAGTVASADVSDIAVHCVTPAVPPGLDTTFGGTGRVSTPVGGGQGEAVVIQPGGGIVTAGWRTVGAGTDFALTRHDASGNLDQSFGTNGIATTDLGGRGDQAYDAALLPDGGIVAVGETDAAGIQKQQFALARYTAAGTLNPSFGTGGTVTTDFTGHGDVANAVAVQGDGKIVVAGFAFSSGIDGDFALARYNADGSLDTSFGTGGKVTTDLGTNSDGARAIAIQPDGAIVVVGTAGEDIALARYTTDGKLDATFGTGGKTITDLGFSDVANGVALTPAGQIVIAGYTVGAHSNWDFLLARYRSDGTLDSTFGSGGHVTTDVGGGDDFAENIAVDAQGRIILVGRATSSTILDMALVRYTADGTPDASFDGDGLLTVDFHGRGEFGQDVALDAAGRIVAAGYTANGGDTQFALLRVNP